MTPQVQEADTTAALSDDQLRQLHQAKRLMAAARAVSPRDPLAYARPVFELGLERYVVELDVQGYTVIPPDRVTTPDVVASLAQKLLSIIEQRTGVPHSLDGPGNPGRYMTTATGADTLRLFYLLLEDEIFDEWLENPVMAAMVDYLMRGKAQLSSLTSFVRWHNSVVDDPLSLALHADSPGSPENVLPQGWNVTCNGTLVLTEYTRDNGALAVVPGSHRYGRHPMPGEAVADAVPVECPAGSLILWHGTTWHGAFPRKNPGLRLNLVASYCNQWYKPQEAYRGNVPPEVLARRSPRFGRLVGVDDPMGWKADGPPLSNPTIGVG
jgi:hypothetical protein